MQTTTSGTWLDENTKKRGKVKEKRILFFFFPRLAEKRPREMRKIINKEIDIPQCIKSPEAASKRVLQSGEQVDRTERSSFRFIQFIKLLLCAPRCSKFSAEERSELIGALNLNELRASWLVLLKYAREHHLENSFNDEILIKKFSRTNDRWSDQVRPESPSMRKRLSGFTSGIVNSPPQLSEKGRDRRAKNSECEMKLFGSFAVSRAV